MKHKIEARLMQLRQQMDGLLLQKYKLGEQMTQVQGNIDATFGAIQFAEQLLEGMNDDADSGGGPDQ
jgi:hypothetical protein